MKSRYFIVALTSLVCASASAVAGSAIADNASTVIQKSIDAMHLRREEATYTLTLSGPGGEQGTRRMRVWYKSQGKEGDSDLKLRIVLTEPADLRGTGFLTLVGAGGHPKDQFLYLPAYRKIRRIGAGNESEPFLDSDFTLEDVSVESKGKFTYALGGSAACPGAATAQCFVLNGTPAIVGDGSYSRKTVYVRKDNYLAMRTDYYNSERKLEKSMTLSKFHRDAASGRSVPDRLEMKNAITGHLTVLEIEKRVPGDPSDALFTQRALEGGVR